MRQRLIVAFAIVASLLVVTTLPMAGAYSGDKVVVGSQHTDFGSGDEDSPQSLENLLVNGGGDSATVELGAVVGDIDEGGLEDVDTFEDGDLDEYQNDKDGGSATISTQPAIDSQSLKLSGARYYDQKIRSQTGLNTYPEAGGRFSTKVYLTHSNEQAGVYFGTQSETSGYNIFIDGSSSQVSIQKDGGDLSSTNTTIPTDEWLTIEVEWGTGGTINAIVRDSDGNDIATVSATDTEYTSGGIGFEAINNDGSYEVYFDEMKANYIDSAKYVSAIHEVTKPGEAVVNVSAINDISINASVRTTGGDILSEKTITSSGSHSLDLQPTASEKVETVLSLSRTGSNPEFVLDDESILFTNHAPSVDSGSATPSGSKEIENRTVDLSINASDQEFGSAQGESVTVTFYDASNDNVIGSDTLSSNGTATTEWGDISGGTNQWYAIVEDEYGGEIQSETFSFEVPQTLYIRNETDTTQLIDDPVEATVRFYGNDEIYSRTVNDGTVNMAGLPVNEDFIVEIEASQDYYSRTVYIQSIFEQQTVYLLSTSENSVESRFELEDPTGQYDSETVVFIEKPINQSGTISYRTVHADQFGSEGVTAQLDDGARYRIRIRSQSGTTQDIGPYRADVAESVTVRPGSPTIELGELEDGWASNATVSNDTIEYVYSDPGQLTDSVTVTAYEKGNESNTLNASREYFGLGNLSGTYSLSEKQTEKTWIVEFDINRDGEQYTVTEELSNRPDLVPGLSDAWRLVIGIGIMLVSAGVFSILNASVGGVVVAIEGGILWWTGWLGGATTGAAVVIALFVAVTVHIYSSSGP